MAGETYARFVAPESVEQYYGNFKATPLKVGDFRPGQYDGGAKGYGSHDPKDGWFKLLDWSMYAQRPKDLTTEAKAGNINKHFFRLVKHFGRLSPLTMKALSGAFVFDLEIEYTGRQGEKSEVMNGYYLKNAFIYRNQFFIGSGKDGSAVTTLATGDKDTTELETIYIVCEKVLTGLKKTASLARK